MTVGTNFLYAYVCVYMSVIVIVLFVCVRNYVYDLQILRNSAIFRAAV